MQPTIGTNGGVGVARLNERLRFAHLTDPHFTEPRFTNWREICNKRALSVLSWRLNRRHKYKREVFETLLRDAAGRTDLFAITGDLTQAGLTSECEQARAWLAGFAGANRLCLIPGNHDSTYLGGPAACWEAMWHEWMGEDSGFPFVRIYEPLAFIGLSSAVPTAPLLASGRLGSPQLERLPHVLRRCREQGLCRVLLVHHCPAPSVDSPRRGLLDAEPLRAIIAKEGVELVLHGHNHRWMRHELEGPDVAVPVLCAPSAASLGTPDGRYRAGYHLIEVQRKNRGWNIDAEARELDGAGSKVLDTLRFDVPVAWPEA